MYRTASLGYSRKPELRYRTLVVLKAVLFIGKITT